MHIALHEVLTDSHSSPRPRGPTHQTTQTKLVHVSQKDEGEKPKGLGGSVIPEPLTPYPYYIATAFFTVIFENTPLNR